MASRNCASTRTTGLSEFMLLWNTVEMSRQRRARRSSSGRCVMSVPSKVMLPPLMRPGRCSSRSSAVAERRLARARLADQADELAGLDAEADLLHGIERAVRLRLVADRQVLDLEQAHASSLRWGLLSRSTPKLMNDMPVMRMARTRPGTKTHSQRPCVIAPWALAW